MHITRHADRPQEQLEWSDHLLLRRDYGKDGLQTLEMEFGKASETIEAAEPQLDGHSRGEFD